MKFNNQLKSFTLIKVLLVLSTVIFTSLSLSSCKDNDDKYIQPSLVINSGIEGNTITFNKEGGVYELSITANRKWSLNSSVDWIAFNPSSGEAGRVKIEIKALANNGFVRTGSITIESGTVKQSISVRQDGEGGNANVVIFNHNFKDGLGCWTTAKKEEAGHGWSVGNYKDKDTQEIKDSYAQVSAYDRATGKGVVTKALLISPMVDFKTTTIFTFKYKPHHAVAGTTLKVVLLDEQKEFVGDALQTIDVAEPTNGFAKVYTDVTVNIPLTENAKYIALYYEADETHTTGFQVNEMKLMGEEGSIPVNCGDSPTPDTPSTPSGDAINSFNVDFESGNLSNGWESKALSGSRKWTVKEYKGNKYVEMSSYKTTETDKVILSTPLLDLSKNSTLTFKSKIRFARAGTILKVILLDSDKNELSVLQSYDLNSDHEFELQTIDITANTNAKYIGFVYEGDVSHTATIQLDDIVLSPKGGTTPTPDPTPTDPNMSVVIFDQPFSESMGCWTVKKNLADGTNWELGKYTDKKTKVVKDYYVKISAYNPNTQSGVPTKSLLISPMVDFKTATVFTFKYKSYYAKAGTTLKTVLLDEQKEIIGDALHTIDVSEPAKGFAREYTDVTVNVPLTANSKYIALYYEADETHTTGFQVKNAVLKGANGSIPVQCDNNGGGTTPTPSPTPTDPNTGSGTTSGTEIFFVAYGEGSSSNKYVSIYNPTDNDIDLSSYTIKMNQFGKKGHYKDFETTLSGTIPAKGVIVYKKDNADYTGEATVLPNNVMNFNGDDNIGLFKNGNMIDVIGTWGEAWVNGNNPVGADKTLHRKTSVNAPNTTFNMDEWEQFDKDSTEPFGKR